MSKFLIFKSESPNPEQDLKKINYFTFLTGVLIPVSIVISDFISSDGFRYVFLVVMILFVIFLFIWLYRKSHKLLAIGELHIGSYGFEKILGDLKNRVVFDGLTCIRATKYAPLFGIHQSKTGYHSYIVRFEFKNQHPEVFLLSAQAIENSQISILDNLNYLKKELKIEMICH